MTDGTIEVNGRGYGRPEHPVVVVCIDGSEPAYHEEAIAAGRMPFLAAMLETGTDLRADSVIPSFTNPNNLAIATGVPPARREGEQASARRGPKSAWRSSPTWGG